MSKKPARVMRFRITLDGIKPPIWRLIDVPEAYSFWDLHVAIQDSMGWLDYHLHSFNTPRGHDRIRSNIGIPDHELDNGVVAGWEVPLSSFFVEIGDRLEYEYDFGDGWSHEIMLVGILLKEPRLKYPLCVDGRRACPPEDCGGIEGYEELLKVLADSSHDEHKDMVEWLTGHAKNYWPYKPDEFDPGSVKFDNPKKRFKVALSQRFQM